MVTKSDPPYAIKAGNPARTESKRFEDEIISQLMLSNWCDYHTVDILSPGPPTRVESFIDSFRDRVSSRSISKILLASVNSYPMIEEASTL